MKKLLEKPGDYRNFQVSEPFNPGCQLRLDFRVARKVVLSELLFRIFRQGVGYYSSAIYVRTLKLTPRDQMKFTKKVVLSLQFLRNLNVSFLEATDS